MELDIQKVFKEHYRALVYFAISIIHNEQDAEDIVIDIIGKLNSKDTRFGHSVNLKAYLYAAVKNACLDKIRSQQRHNRSHRDILHLSGEADDGSARLEEELITAHVLQVVYNRIDEFPPQLKAIFTAYFFKGKTTEEIAAAMNLTPRTVLNQKTRGIRLLREYLLKKAVLFFILFMTLFT